MADPRETETASPQSVEEIQEEIEQTREQLAATVHALGEKADLRGRATRRTRALWQEHRTALAATGAAGVLGMVGLVVWRRRR